MQQSHGISSANLIRGVRIQQGVTAKDLSGLGVNMNQIFFAHNAEIVRSTFPVSTDLPTRSLEELTQADPGTLEKTLGVFLLCLAGPFIFALAVLNKLTSRGPAFYSQIRVGKNGKAFPVFKLRTMVVEAEEKTGPILSWSGDPRVTRFGQFLRKTHLDELPQLWNIIRGDMSFIGPRPERPEFVNRFRGEVGGYEWRLKVKPGITGLAQICCGYDASAAEKLEYDLVYIRNRQSLRMHVFILFRTLLKVVWQQ